MTAKTAEDRLRYAKQNAILLQTGDATTLLQVPPNKPIHIMKALSSLARFTGQTDNWRAIRQRYGMQWSTDTEKLDAFTRFFDDSKDLDTMIRWLNEAMQVLPTNYANFFLFCTLTGMRASECIEAVRLLNGHHQMTDYYNLEQNSVSVKEAPPPKIINEKSLFFSPFINISPYIFSQKG